MTKDELIKVLVDYFTEHTTSDQTVTDAKEALEQAAETVRLEHKQNALAYLAQFGLKPEHLFDKSMLANEQQKQKRGRRTKAEMEAEKVNVQYTDASGKTVTERVGLRSKRAKELAALTGKKITDLVVE